MKVSMIIPHFLPHIGGGEQLYYDIAKGIMCKGHEVRVISCSSGGVIGFVPYDGINAYYYNWKMFCGHPIVESKDLKEHIEWADIVHTTLFTPALKTRRMAKKLNKPCILTIYEVLGNKWFWFDKSLIRPLLFDFYERLICMQKFQAYHVISDATKTDFKKFCGKNKEAVRVYCCVHMPSINEIVREKITLKDYFGIKDNDRCFLYFGRPAPNKGVFVLEEAIHILHERGVVPDDVKFCWILAQDPAMQRKKLLEKVNKHKIEQYVCVKPSLNRNQLFKVILDADYVVIPSVTEGFGFCAVEACYLGKKVIYSNGGSLPEVVFGQCIGFENRDAYDLAQKIQMVIERGDEALKNIPEKKFEEEQMINGIINIYEQVLGH